MKIISLFIDAEFSYLWLKRITGVDLSQHCAKSLPGDYDTRISKTIDAVFDIDLEDGIYYLCGVSSPYRWSNNFHLAFTNGDDVLTICRNGISIVISGAKELPINENSATNLQHPKLKYKSYRTCRNWQFANYLKESGIF